MMSYAVLPSPVIAAGRYEVLARDLRLNGIGEAPPYFWVVRNAGGKYLIETSEDDGYWVREEDLELAVLRGWVRRLD